ARGSEIHAARIERVNGHRVAQHVDVAVPLRQTFSERLPLVSACPTAVYAQLSLGWIVLRIALDRDNVDGVRLVRVHVNWKPEVAGQVSADLAPRLAGVIAAHDVPVLLHEEYTGTRPVHRDAVNAVANLGIRVGDVLGLQAAVDRLPRLAGVVAAERARSRDGDKDPLGIARVQKNGVQAHPARTWLPAGPCAVAAQSREFLPRLPAVRRAEQACVFHSGVHGIRIRQRRCEMPDALELPGMLRAVVPLMR